MFQPEGGQPAQGTIQPDGTFELWTFTPADGASSGPNRVRVICYEKIPAAPSAGVLQNETPLGRLVIPERYTEFSTSGLTVDVPPQGDDNVVINLESS
jgi:hypothetical protein